MFFDPLNTIQTQNEAYYQLYLSVISTHYAIKPKYIVKSEFEPKQIVDMVKEILAGYTRDSIPETK